MKLLTHLIYTLLITSMLACGGNDKRKKRMEMRDSLKTLHPDSIVKYREARWEDKKAKIDAKFDSLKVAKDTINE
tara:strand:+ start:515 stop:739 length:225 start_codon:yes stop_codon:yes gene_type:complete